MLGQCDTSGGGGGPKSLKKKRRKNPLIKFRSRNDLAANIDAVSLINPHEPGLVQIASVNRIALETNLQAFK
jgi:hypothetical protein